MDFKAIRPLLCVRDCEVESSPLNFTMIMDMPEDSPFFTSDNFRLVVDGVRSHYLILQYGILFCGIELADAL
jgi:hypothetical protein